MDEEERFFATLHYVLRAEPCGDLYINWRGNCGKGEKETRAKFLTGATREPLHAKLSQRVLLSKRSCSGRVGL